MATLYDLFKELMTGAGILAIITVAPDILVKLRLGFSDCDPNCMMSYTCPGVWIYMLSALLLTALLINSRYLRCHVVVLLIWLSICGYRFLMDINSQACVIDQIMGYGNPSGPIFIVLVYLLILFLTVDLIVKWITNN
ncbi:hypothetical protein KR038_006482 [Drosophila bunnanda]|nr:hypothetical protein KR038_006482 [Drosophila bunnanda]